MAISARLGAAAEFRGLKAELLATECRHAQANTPGCCSPGWHTQASWSSSAPPIHAVFELEEFQVCFRFRPSLLGDMKMCLSLW